MGSMNRRRLLAGTLGLMALAHARAIAQATVRPKRVTVFTVAEEEPRPDLAEGQKRRYAIWEKQGPLQGRDIVEIFVIAERDSEQIERAAR